MGQGSQGLARQLPLRANLGPQNKQGDAQVKQVEVGCIGVGWIGGLRAETLSRTALVDKLHLCDIRPDRLAEVKALYKPATTTLDYNDIINNRTSRWCSSRPRRRPTTIRSRATA